MRIFTLIIVAIEHFGFMGLEMIAPSNVISKAFDIPKTEVEQPNLRMALANQGLYNGFVALAILLALFIPTIAISKIMLLFFLGFVMIAAGYGALTVTKKIILFQGLPALVTFLLVLFAF